MNLWPHQLEALASCRNWFRGKRSRVLVQAPPGTGKTEIACRAALSFVADRPFGRAVICVSSLAILGQFHRRLASLTRIPIGIEQAQRHAQQQKLVIASLASLRGRLDNYPSNTLLILDEAHHANEEAQITLDSAAHFDHVLSLTASPWSQGMADELGRSQRLQLKYSDALRAGLVAPYLLPSDWIEPHGPFGLVFCPTNQAAKKRSAELPRASWIGVDSGEVQTRIAHWKTGRFGVLCANRMLWEGFDEPRCATVWLDRSTESEIALVQMAGRALRYQTGKTARIYTHNAAHRARLLTALLRLDLPI